MAELKGGSTVGGNEIWHRGNHGENSGLDADKLKGKNWTVGATAPISPSVDDVWIDTASSLIKVWNGTVWSVYSGDFSNKITFKTSDTSSASINLPHGVAPSSPENGDIWTTTSGLMMRLNGTTRTLAHTGSWGTVSQAEAEAGTATTARLWTAQRVSQAIAKQAQPMADRALADAKTYIDEQMANFSPSISAYKHVLFAEVDNKKFFDVSDIFNPLTDTIVDVAQNGWSLSANKYEIKDGGIHLWDSVNKNTIISFTILKNVGLKEQHTPFIDGNGVAGYYGKVNNLTTGNNLIAKTGITAGTTLVSGDITWLKFSYNYKTLLIADRPIKSNLSWDGLQALSLVSGKSIEINGKEYVCRLMTGGNSNPASSAGGEWDDLIVRFTPNSSDSNWNTHYTWCQEAVSSDVNNRVLRGYNAVSIFSNTSSNSVSSIFGYRPVLELL